MSLANTRSGTLIEVSDNGRGFDPAATKAGRGMGTIASRANRIGATLTWQRQSSGTTLSLLLPRIAAAG